MGVKVNVLLNNIFGMIRNCDWKDVIVANNFYFFDYYSKSLLHFILINRKTDAFTWHCLQQNEYLSDSGYMFTKTMTQP